MTNLVGLSVLYLLVGVFVACLLVALLLGGVLRSIRRGDEPAGGTVQLLTVLALAGIVVSVVAWGVAFVYIRPDGMVERLARRNFVLLGLLIGYTLPAIVGLVVLRRLRARR